MGNITGALIENAFQPQQNDDLSDSPPLNVEEEIKRIARDSSNRELYRLLHAKMEQTALDRAAAAHAPSMNSEGGCGDGGGAGKKWESSGRRPSSEEQSSVRCGSAGGRGGPQCVVENAPLSSECGSGGKGADGKSGGLTTIGSKPESDGGREPPRMGFFKKNLLKSYWTENEDTSGSAAKTDPPATVPEDAGKKLDVSVEVNAKDGAANSVLDRRSLSTDFKTELLGDNDAAKPRTKLMNINTCIEVIVMNELKKLDSVPDDLPGPRQMPLFATLEASRTRLGGETRGNDLARVNAGGNRNAVEPGWPLRNESGGRAVDTEPKREKWPQYVNVDAVPERAPSEFSPQQQLMARKTDIGTAGGGSRNVPSSAYRGGGYPPEVTNMNQEVPRIYTSSSGDSIARNVRLTNQFGESGVDVVPTSHGGGGPVVKYSPSSAWSRDISPAQSSPHVMMSSDSSGFKVMPSSAASASQLPSMPMLDQRRKPERESESVKYQQQAEYLSYVGQQQQYHSVSNLPEQHSAAAYQNCAPVLQEKLHASSDLGHYGYPSKNPRERAVHAGQFDSSSFGNHPDNLQPPVANYIKHSPKNSPILAYERDGTARPLGPPEPQYHHRPDQPQYHPRNDQAQYHHRNDQAAQYHRSDQLLKSQPGSLMAGSARSYRMVGDQPPPQQQQVQAPQPPPVPQVYYRSERQTRGELVPMVDKKGFPAYQSVPQEEYVERRMKRPSASSSSSSSTTRGEMGNVSVGLDHQQQQQQQQQQPILRSLSISYPPRGGGGRGGGGEVAEKGHWGHSSEETPLDLTVKKEFPDAHHHHPAVASYHLPPGMKQQQQQQQADWGAVARGGYRQSYAGEEDPLGARLMNRATAAPQKPPDFPMPEMQRRDMLDVRSSVYDKVPSGLQQQAQHPPPESEMGRMVPTAPAAVNERSMAMRTSVIASHPFDDSPSGLAPPPLHLTMQQLSEALTKTSTHQMGAWKQSPYGGGEMVPRSRAHTLESEPSSRLTIDASSRQERPRPRPSNSGGNDLLHLATTSPTIPHLSPVQPLVSTAASSQQAPGSRRAMGPSLLGSHSPSDILHLQCKVCGSTYGSLRSFRMHFAKVHGLEPLPEHCNISTISGTKNAMSGKAAMEDSEPPALQRETMPTDVASVGKNRGGFESFGNAAARPAKPDVLRVEPAPANIRTKQVAEVYPMPARTTSRGLSPQLKAEGSGSGWRAELTELHAEQNEGQMKVGGDVKNSGRLVNCDLGIFRSRNCYSDLGCDRDTDCPECLDGFKDISDWKMHISTHMMRSCTCKACNLSFTHSGALKKHLHAVHSHVDKVEVEYRCLFCREAFSDEKVLFYHTQEHEKRYSRLDNSRRDSISSSSLSFKAAGSSGGADPDCIQMAVPDTTCSDDARPTSEFGGESSSNVSPSSFPGVDSKGGGSTTTETKADPSALCPGTLDAGRTDDDRKVKTGDLELGYKHRAMLRGLDSSSDHSRGSEHARLDVAAAASQLLYRSHGVQHVHKSDDREMSAESKLDAKFSFDIGEECRHFKPTVTPPRAVVEETSTFVWKKQAVLKRVQSGESRDAIDADPNAPPTTDKLSPVSSRSASMSRGGAGGSGAAEKSPSEVSQPMHLRDLFSMMGQQVEKSIWGIPDFPQFNSAPAARGSRCVRDVCDEIIALSFREESSPRDPPPAPPGSMSDKSDTIAKSTVCEQLKTLVNPDHDARPELVLPEVRPNPEGLYGGAWTRSPCSSRDSCHSLEIDESRFNQDSAEGESNRLESTDSELPRSLYGDPVVESTSPRRDYGRKESTETPEDGKHPVDGDAKVAFGGRGHRGRDDEGGMVVRHSDAFFSRRPSSEGPQPPVDTATTMSRTKDVRSPSSLSKQEASADGDDGKSSDSNPVVGSKRKHHASDGAKEAGDTVVDEPPTKKSAPS